MNDSFDRAALKWVTAINVFVFASVHEIWLGPLGWV